MCVCLYVCLLPRYIAATYESNIQDGRILYGMLSVLKMWVCLKGFDEIALFAYHG